MAENLYSRRITSELSYLHFAVSAANGFDEQQRQIFSQISNLETAQVAVDLIRKLQDQDDSRIALLSLIRFAVEATIECYNALEV